MFNLVRHNMEMDFIVLPGCFPYCVNLLKLQSSSFRKVEHRDLVNLISPHAVIVKLLFHIEGHTNAQL